MCREWKGGEAKNEGCPIINANYKKLNDFKIFRRSNQITIKIKIIIIQNVTNKN